MGVGCVVNAKRCGRLHRYVTGPIFLLAAVYVMPSQGNVVPLRTNLFALLVLGAAACFAELPFGHTPAELEARANLVDAERPGNCHDCKGNDR